MDPPVTVIGDVSVTALTQKNKEDAETQVQSRAVLPLEVRDPKPVVPPDGGLQAWLTIIGGWMVLFCAFGYSSSFGVYQAYYQSVGTSTASNISWIGSLQLFLMFAMGLPAGKLFDEGYFKHTQAVGAFLYVFGLFMLSLADPTKYYQVFLSQGVCVGIGSGMIYVPALSVQAHHWRRRRALAMGIVLTGSSIGGIIYPIMLNKLFHKPSVGFRWGVRASAFLSLGLLVIANCIMSTRLPNAKERRKLNPDQTPAQKPSLKRILTDWPFMLSVFGVFLVLWGLFFPYFYLQLFISSKGLSTNLAFYSLSILNAASIFGRTIPNMLADNFGQLNVLIPIGAGSGILLWAVFGVSNPGGAVVFALLYGFFSGAFVSLIPPLLAVLSTDVSEIGIRMGVAFFFTSFANLTGTPITGALLGTKEPLEWYKPIVFSGVTVIAGTAFLVPVRIAIGRRRNTNRI